MYHENDAAVLLLFDEVIHGNANNTNRMGTGAAINSSYALQRGENIDVVSNRSGTRIFPLGGESTS